MHYTKRETGLVGMVRPTDASAATKGKHKAAVSIAKAVSPRDISGIGSSHDFTSEHKQSANNSLAPPTGISLSAASKKRGNKMRRNKNLVASNHNNRFVPQGSSLPSSVKGDEAKPGSKSRLVDKATPHQSAPLSHVRHETLKKGASYVVVTGGTSNAAASEPPSILLHVSSDTEAANQITLFEKSVSPSSGGTELQDDTDTASVSKILLSTTDATAANDTLNASHTDAEIAATSDMNSKRSSHFIAETQSNAATTIDAQSGLSPMRHRHSRKNLLHGSKDIPKRALISNSTMAEFNSKDKKLSAKADRRERINTESAALLTFKTERDAVSKLVVKAQEAIQDVIAEAAEDNKDNVSTQEIQCTTISSRHTLRGAGFVRSKRVTGALVENKREVGAQSIRVARPKAEVRATQAMALGSSTKQAIQGIFAGSIQNSAKEEAVKVKPMGSGSFLRAKFGTGQSKYSTQKPATQAKPETATPVSLEKSVPAGRDQTFVTHTVPTHLQHKPIQLHQAEQSVVAQNKAHKSEERKGFRPALTRLGSERVKAGTAKSAVSEVSVAKADANTHLVDAVVIPLKPTAAPGQQQVVKNKIKLSTSGMKPSVKSEAAKAANKRKVGMKDWKGSKIEQVAIPNYRNEDHRLLGHPSPSKGGKAAMLRSRTTNAAASVRSHPPGELKLKSQEIQKHVSTHRLQRTEAVGKNVLSIQKDAVTKVSDGGAVVSILKEHVKSVKGPIFTSANACVESVDFDEVKKEDVAALEEKLLGGGLTSQSSGSLNPRRAKVLSWDEENILKYDLERGTHMTIEEPKTPYVYDESINWDNDDNDAYGSLKGDVKEGSLQLLPPSPYAIDPQELMSQLMLLKDHDTVITKHERELKEKRRKHYNEFLVLQQLRGLNSLGIDDKDSDESASDKDTA